jgi:glycosyltransferase involved in cell wall biosynthesis
MLERAVRDLTHTVIAVSAEEEREALRLGYARDRVALIRNGVPSCEPGPLAVRESGPLTVGFVGRLSRQKGPDLLLDAAADVVAHVPQARFVFFGEGELSGALHDQVDRLQLGSHVVFKGAFAQGEAVPHMRQMDVVAVPSRWEGCPYVILEAFQAGAPVVAAAVGGVPDLVRHGENGVCVAADDAEALCDGLLGVLRDPDRRRQLAERGRADVAAWTVERMARSVGDVYSRACGV